MTTVNYYRNLMDITPYNTNTLCEHIQSLYCQLIDDNLTLVSVRTLIK